MNIYIQLFCGIVIFSLNGKLLHAQTIQDPYTEIVKEFLTQVGNNKLDSAYQLTIDSFWGSQERFSSKEGFGGITFIEIDTVFLIKGITHKDGSSLVFARYYARDPENESKWHELDFHVQKSKNGKLHILKASKHYFDILADATVGRIDYKDRVFEYNYTRDQVIFKRSYSYLDTRKSLYNDFINKKVAKLLLYEEAERVYDHLTLVENLDKVAQSFHEEYARFKKDKQRSIYLNMESSRSFIIIDQIGPLVILENEISEYRGGNHGQIGRIFFTYNLKDKQRLEFSQIFDTAHAEQISILYQNKLTEKYLQISEKESDIEPMINIDKIDLERGSIRIHRNGFQICYNPYIIAPFSYGIISFELGWEEVKPYLSRYFEEILSL